MYTRHDFYHVYTQINIRVKRYLRKMKHASNAILTQQKLYKMAYIHKDKMFRRPFFHIPLCFQYLVCFLVWAF